MTERIKEKRRDGMGKEMEERGGKMGLKERKHKRKRRRLLKREGVKREKGEGF